MIVRDDPTLEVFMLRRTHAAVFAPGAYVFPGGAVDRDDAHVRSVGRSSASADALMGRAGALDHWVAAAREAFEEAGFLLTTSAPHALLAARDALNAGDQSFGALLAEHDVAVDTAAMHVFSHWRTPVGAPRRFDTWFFLAAAPADQEGAHDDNETVHSEWVRPVDMLGRWQRGAVDLVFPTMRTMRALARFETASDLLDAVRAAEADAGHAAPRVLDDSSGQRIALDAPERARATRGWRPLRSRWRADARQEAIDRAEALADEDEGAA
jgi:8-oxo-dGTP pyrophosphatase MutT (NUDIX family)